MFNRTEQAVKRRRGSPDHVSRFLSRPALATMLDHARQIELLNQAIQACLPQPLQDHCQLINHSGGDLVFHADSPVWAARFRLQGPGLRGSLERVLGKRVEKLHIRVSPPTHSKPVSASEDEYLRPGFGAPPDAHSLPEPAPLEITLKRLRDRASVKKSPIRKP